MFGCLLLLFRLEHEARIDDNVAVAWANEAHNFWINNKYKYTQATHTHTLSLTHPSESM